MSPFEVAAPRTYVNLGELEREIAVDWSALGLHDERIVRDLWRQQDLGRFTGRFAATVGRHGVAAVRIRPAD